MPKFLEILKSNWVKLLIIAVAIYFIVMYVNKTESIENVEGEVVAETQQQAESASLEPSLAAPGDFAPVQAAAVEVTPEEQQKQIEKVVAGPAQLSSEDLLPQYDDANEFAKENPVSKLLKEQNFLVSGYHIGINTVLQSNKIPYLDIRSLPPIPKEQVGPWNQSSYESQKMRRGFEIGV
jgi:hypothetical protein